MKKIIISFAMLALVACSDTTSTSTTAAVDQEEDLFYCEADGHYYMHKEDYDDFCGKFDWENSPFVWEDEDGFEDAEGEE